MANHIKYIDIHKFKGIKDINIYDMKSINIFVGDNNSGKTTILEAIKFFEKPFDYLSHLRLMSRKYNPRSIKYSKIKEIFNECKLENEININLESNGENYNLHIKGFEEEEIYFEDYELLGEDESNERTILEYTFNSEKREFILENRKKSRISLSKNNLKLINMGYAMPIDTYLEKSTLNAIDTVIKKGDKWKLIELLKIFDNSIIDINYTSDQEIYITTQDKSILSLSSFGDGLKKAIVLISKVMDAYNGVLLIDEIENGIHKDVLGKIFNEVIRNSKEYKELREESGFTEKEFDKKVQKILDAGITDVKRMKKILKNHKLDPTRYNMDSAIKYSKLAKVCSKDTLENQVKFIRFCQDRKLGISEEEMAELKKDIMNFK